MRKFLLCLAVILGSFGLCAQVNAWMEKAPGKYLPATTRTIITSTSACNQGSEAFMNFIPKFRTDKKFRNSRIRLAADDEMGASSVEFFENWQIIKAGKGVNRREGYRYFGTWYSVTADNVCFEYQDYPTDPNAEWGGSSAQFRFQRIDGKWYLTGIMLAG